MKKIKNMREFQAEKSRLQLHLADLENKIKNNWRDVKASINPFNMLKQAFNKVFTPEQAGAGPDGEGKGTWSEMASVVAGRFAHSARENLEKLFKHKNNGTV